jgi:Fic family protein
MIKMPGKAPNWTEIVKKDLNQIFEFYNNPEIQALIEKTDRLYYYWDKVRSQPLSKDLNRLEVWAFLRFRRFQNSLPSPILDLKNNPFMFWITDDVQSHLHFIDQSIGGAFWDKTGEPKAAAKYMISSLMEEAITSSQIEGAVATIKEAKKMLLEKRKPRDKSEQMIYNNYLTMQSLKKISQKKLDKNLLLDLHATITYNTLDDKSEEGRLRKKEDNVRIESSYDEVLFIPPPADEIEDRLTKLIEFANDKTSKPFIHPVIKAIMLHFWMAYIHPFTDGNGRMARTLFYWYMLKHDYWLFEYTSISKIILKKTTQYAHAYLYSENDDNDLTYFIHFNIDVIREAIEDLKNHIKQEREKNQQMLVEISEHNDLNMRQTQILKHIKSNPNDVLTIKIHQNMTGVAYQSARTDLLELAEKGWLKMIKKGKTYYFVPADNIHNKFA